MSKENGVIRIGRKGIKKFAFGEDGEPFEVDVVVAFQEWIRIDDEFRDVERNIPLSDMINWHQAAVNFVTALSGGDIHKGTLITVAEALDFIARLRECYDEVAVFFRPKSREERDSPDSTEAELRFSTETL